MSEAAVIAEGLRKVYGEAIALNNVDFRIAKGELYGFIGPDGAGKSTLFRILTSLLTPDAGRARVLELDVVEDYRELRPLLGYMPGRFGLYGDLSVAENLAFFASVFGTTVGEGYALIEPIYRQLEPFRDRLAGDLSGGMKQKLALSCALVHRPRLLILDEPTTGVDAVSRQEFWEMLSRITSEGITVVVSTPYMDEANQCDRVALMQQGEVLQVATPETLAGSMDRTVWAVRGRSNHELIGRLRSLPELRSVHAFGATVHVTAQERDLGVEQMAALLRERLSEPLEIDSVRPSVEDVFMALMGQKEGYAHE